MTHYTLAGRMAVAAFLVLAWTAAGLAQSAQQRTGATRPWGDVARRGTDDVEMVFIPPFGTTPC
jgi:hypothetical protein